LGTIYTDVELRCTCPRCGEGFYEEENGYVVEVMLDEALAVLKDDISESSYNDHYNGFSRSDLNCLVQLLAAQMKSPYFAGLICEEFEARGYKLEKTK